MSFENAAFSESRPDIEQFGEYRELLTSIVQAQGRGIRYARQEEKAKTRVGTEYFLPGAATEYSIPDRKMRIHTLRERRYSASFRPIGEHAGRLLVLESDSVLLPSATYGTQRNIYRFMWDQSLGVVESEVLPVEIISSTHVDAEVLPIEPFGIKDVLSLDQEHTAHETADQGGEYQRFVNPFREKEYPWKQVNAVDFVALHDRTDDFGKALLSDK